jgi:uncharacterized protein YjbJ (UPF0337 family)
MNSDILKGKWTEMKGQLQRKWGRLSDSDYDEIAGNVDVLVGRLQQRYGYQKERAEREVHDVIKQLANENAGGRPGRV